MITELFTRRRMLLGAVVCAASTACGAPPRQDSGSAAASAQRWAPDTPSWPGRVPAQALPLALARVDRGDADATARAVVQVWFSWNPHIDHGPNDAAARCAPLLSADLWAQVTTNTAVSGPGIRWLDWAARGAVASVRVDPSTEAVPPQTPDHAIRAFAVTQSWFTDDGQRLEENSFTARVQLLRAGQGWEVNRVEQ